MQSIGVFARIAALGILFVSVVALTGCGEEKIEQPYDTNILRNGSFEEVDKNGMPKYWVVSGFRGLDGEESIVYGVDNTTAVEGHNSFQFKADPGTRRFMVVSQEVEVRDVSQIRLRGWMQLDQVKRNPDQWAHCNFLIKYFDDRHKRFQELRAADKRSRLKIGTSPWFEEDLVFRVPQGTHYIEVSFLLGMDGVAWFDNISLEIPRPMPWETSTTENFVFRWLPGHPFPEGARVSQQRIFDYYASKLGVESDVVLKYFLYPDTSTIREMLSIRGYESVSFTDNEIHTINPNENHEVVHFITDEYGKPPRALSEGTVYWLMDDWLGYPVHTGAAVFYLNGTLCTMAQLSNYNEFTRLDPSAAISSAASFVRFIVDRWGAAKLLEFYGKINGVNSYEPFSQGFEAVYGVTVAEVEDSWRLLLSRTEIPESLSGGAPPGSSDQ